MYKRQRVFWIRQIHLLYFSEEIHDLNYTGQVKKRSNIRSLAPFVDSNGIIRVGGRLTQAKIHYDQKHPILLPEKDYITELIIRREHVISMHSGPQALLAQVRRQFWPINGKLLTKRIIKKCVTCSRNNPNVIFQPMGNLPACRVIPDRPFINCGIDYCGPIFIKRVMQRKSAPYKAYIALFICMATKSIHIEIVTSLTTSAFLAALRRFMSRRGRVINIYSDNATKFIGARNELQELRKFIRENKEYLTQSLAEENINWHFISANSPHFGGLWEAGVKTVKHHIKRVVGNIQLTFEEFNTLLCQIEACVNSRPLTSLSSDPNDLQPLTPGHFLIGSPITSFPEPDLSVTPFNRINRWQRVQQLMQFFWKRWSTEYLSTLQQRTKWTSSATPIQVGSLVLIKEEFRPPLMWNLGRIRELHAGQDGVPRVATVQTSHGLLRRAMTRLCPLPIENTN